MHRQLSVYTLLIALLIVISPAQLRGETLPGYTSLGGARRTLLTTLAAQREHARIRKGIAITPVRLETRAPRIGRIRVVFTSLRARSWNASLGQRNDPLDVALLKGYAYVLRQGRKFRLPAAGAIFLRQGIDTLHTNLVVTSRRGVSYGLEFRTPLSGTQTRRLSVPTSVFAQTSCGASGVGSVEHHGVAAAVRPDSSAATFKELILATVADPLWQTRYGATSNATIAALVNAASTIYENDLGITLTIGEQRSATIAAPIDPTSSSQWLDQFQAYAAANLTGATLDAKYLFTTRDFAQNVIGIAYLGVMCADPDFSVGIMKDVASSINFITFGHELGHNLDASHDPDSGASPCVPAVMCPSVAQSHTSFSTTSKNAIAAHLSSFGSCLASTELTPTPIPSPTATPTPTPTPSPTPSPNDPGSFPDVPTTVDLGSSLSSAGRFQLRIGLGGSLPAGSTYRLLISDSSIFRPAGTKTIALLPVDGPGTYIISTRIQRGVKKRFVSGTRRILRQRIYLRFEVRLNDSRTAKTTSVDPTRVRKKTISLRSWAQLLAAQIATI